MKTQSQVSDVTIQISSKPVLTMPRSLSRQLGVRQGEQVSVQVRNGTLRVRKNGQRKAPVRMNLHSGRRARRTAKLTDLIGAIPAKPGAPKVNIEELMSHHGYDQIEHKAGKAW
ncbi:MAG: hypothetical protein KGJ80_08515 [Chloroflexota bacterium]|nr:hypothetical protein [Chloroflexota bacterium]